jgi:hypothetical protein
MQEKSVRLLLLFCLIAGNVLAIGRRKDSQKLLTSMELAGRASTGAVPEEVISMTASRAESVAGPQVTGERITITLIPTATDDLRRLQERTSLSKTDLANRAITLYEFFDAQLRAGHDLIARDNTTGKTQLVRLLDAPAGQAASAGPASPRRGLAGPTGHWWSPGRHRRPHHLFPRRPHPPIITGWLLHLTGLTGQEVRMP